MDQLTNDFQDALRRLRDASPDSKPSQLAPLLAAISQLMQKPEGMALVFQHIVALEQAGIFADSVWDNPRNLAAPLVGGTLNVGGTTTILEILSELRVLAYALSDKQNSSRAGSASLTQQDARRFLEEVIIHNLDWAFPSATEEARDLPITLRHAIKHLFALLMHHFPSAALKTRLAEEVTLVAAQRPIVTLRIRTMLAKVRSDLSLDSKLDSDKTLQYFLDALYAPSPLAQQVSNQESSQAENSHTNPPLLAWNELALTSYEQQLTHLSTKALRQECKVLSEAMHATGLVSVYHPVLVRYVANDIDLLTSALGLDARGQVQLKRQHAFVQTLIEQALTPETSQTVYGLARLLERGLLARQPVLNGLKRIMTLELHSDVAIDIAKICFNLSPQQKLLAATLAMLGQPLGISQGWSPTCQSARGLSLWSQHAPGKLIDMIISVAQDNNLAMRFGDYVLDSKNLPLGLVETIDARLDAVSIVLVPHLDRLYNEMMRQASYRGDDPHKWVNPALYGHWIPTGFCSAYDTTTQSVRAFSSFVRTFYATHHPDYNGGHDLVYPNPVGLFITSNTGKLLGFHAVSLLRVRYNEQGQVRVYFLNPNDEGRQDWGQDIVPSVLGHGERPGESSLPFAQFAARLYAYHYNERDVGDLDAIDSNQIDEVVDLAKASWGQAYLWTPEVTY
ncbi:MAG: hypothetical protein AAF267_18840 [Deinococcota bacterium]